MLEMKRDVGVAYLLAISTGLFGGHRFYARRTGTAIVMLLLTLTLVFILVSIIWLIVDLFLLPSMVNAVNESIEKRNASFTQK